MAGDSRFVTWFLVNRVLRGIAGCLVAAIAVVHCYPLGSGWH